MEKNNLTVASYIIIALLLVNTFFLGGIWCSLKMACGTGTGKKVCPLTGIFQPKVCPISAKAPAPSLEPASLP